MYRILLVLILLITACSDDKPKTADGGDSDKPNMTDQQLYDLGTEKMHQGSYKGAITQFEEIERLYPFSKLATEAQLLQAYANYKNEDYDDAIKLIDKFTKLHPGNASVPYAVYLKALCYYDRISDVKRDQKITRQALDALKEVVTRFPASEYGRDAKLKIDLVQDHLAGKEMEVGRFYLRGKQYVASMNRFKNVVDNYQTTSHIEEALYRMVEVYLLLGLTEDARNSAAVLGHNYPQSRWYGYAYKLVEGQESGAPAPSESTFGGLFGSDSTESKIDKKNSESLLDKILP